MAADPPPAPFDDLVSKPEASLRAAIAADGLRPEQELVPALFDQLRWTPDEAGRTRALALRLVTRMRAQTPPGGVAGLLRAYDLSTPEGLALMQLAEALLRVPDAPTRDLLIQDKLRGRDWRAHLGRGRPWSVNAATLGLMTAAAISAAAGSGRTPSLIRAAAGLARPLIRFGVVHAVRRVGDHFVAGRAIDEALERGRASEAKGYLHSYDMLGEAAMTAEDATRHLATYETAIHAIGKASAGRGPYAGPGVSIKLSALHPRYERAKRGRVMAELLPRAARLAGLAKAYDIGLNVDAEEADRLDLSLDLFEALALDPALADWQGLGFVVQAYGKRASRLVDWLGDLAGRSQRRLMVRLVKGAYWDAEIKRAQIAGLDGFKVFTRKEHTELSYLACARKLLSATERLFPQFATHNAQTVAAVLAMAGPGFRDGDYEFQALHAMADPVYAALSQEGEKRPVRIYAPVGPHEALLAYLVRRLLENGANSSFLNRVADETETIEGLVADPVAAVWAREPLGAPHERIVAPLDLFEPERRNARGVDLVDDRALDDFAAAARKGAAAPLRAKPTGATEAATCRPVVNPADRRDVVGYVADAAPADIERALALASSTGWRRTPVSERAARLRAAADAMERELPGLAGLIVREAGKTVPNAVAEVREAVDFLRYYAVEAERRLRDAEPIGVGACVSPWNFPLAIFTGQVAAALAAGNAVVAKPAEETPLTAAWATRLLHEAGVPEDALHLVTGDGKVGAALVSDARVEAVVFTGSIEAARSIQRALVGRRTRDGRPAPFIAETGGQNAMVVDSTALPEQVVADVLQSAFDSSGQRCSALRALFLQDEIADRTLRMLKGAFQELEVGRPDRLSTDIGPVITQEARERIEAHVAAMRARGARIDRLPLPAAAKDGRFVAPTIIEIARLADLEREVFGPVLHVLRYDARDLDRVVDAVNATGYALTFGLHSRIDETAARVVERAAAGNVYVNRNIVGAVVGSQPFGGSGLSGTGPKAGGPHYLRRLCAFASDPVPAASAVTGGAVNAYSDWLAIEGLDPSAILARVRGLDVPIGAMGDLPGPVGECNRYEMAACGHALTRAEDESEQLAQVAAVLAAGGVAIVEVRSPAAARLAGLPDGLAPSVRIVEEWRKAEIASALFQGRDDALTKLQSELSELPGAVTTVHVATAGAADGKLRYDVTALLRERSVSINTAAAGGNAELMARA
ncbi:bifunctional proline dehydrogenase/L-glutamate gamma-semialdehyde dehydrogenase PutA [Methylopila turkensis]|uniref:Bifunctional protein PutA n=1 Tax=Methylopila turkensis TaxID=1437816 RepID=A0A9W6JTN1_9HYPH|nr:bifunctional proline dehydrogenase/L-glutamate gamma-semialdehyde dehydrogenase PutA [Methylopila turkensis]GLK81875.1 bifunctional protein PutA [Methylopila turkensis]